MKLSDIQSMWGEDSKIDRNELGEESLRVPQLHPKYFNLFSQERIVLRQLESEYKELYKQKYEYYNGTLSEEELRSNGWEPISLKVLKSDINIYIQADSDIGSGATLPASTAFIRCTNSGSGTISNLFNLPDAMVAPIGATSTTPTQKIRFVDSAGTAYFLYAVEA